VSRQFNFTKILTLEDCREIAENCHRLHLPLLVQRKDVWVPALPAIKRLCLLEKLERRRLFNSGIGRAPEAQPANVTAVPLPETPVLSEPDVEFFNERRAAGMLDYFSSSRGRFGGRTVTKETLDWGASPSRFASAGFTARETEKSKRVESKARGKRFSSALFKEAIQSTYQMPENVKRGLALVITAGWKISDAADYCGITNVESFKRRVTRLRQKITTIHLPNAEMSTYSSISIGA
jgi:hypothetical protein